MNAKVAMIILAALAAGGLAGYWLAGTRATVSGPVGSTVERPPAQPQIGERKVLYWHDPMKPDVKFDKPGKSPFMDMQLVPVYAEESRDAATTVPQSRLTQSLGIRTAEVVRGALDLTFNVTGAIAVDERSLVTVQTRVNGVIEQLYVRAQYDPVARGTPLAAIYSPDWLAAEEEYLALKRSATADAALADAARQRLTQLGLPDAQIRQIEREGKPNPRVILLAPESGLVWEIGAREGAAVGPGVTIFRIANLGSVWVNAEIPEAQAALVNIGAPVEVRTSAFPDRVLKGAVAAILPDVNTQTRTLKARVVVANPGGLLKPGMFANLIFRTGGPHAREVLLVPNEAVIRTGRRSVIIVAGADGALRPVEIEVGRESGDRTEIRSGLEAGQKVVVSGQFLIDSEASLKSALGRMTDPENPPSPANATATPSVPIDKAMGPKMDVKP